MSSEPPQGLVGVVCVCVRLPDEGIFQGDLMELSRWRAVLLLWLCMFMLVTKELHDVVESHKAVNPQHFHPLASDISQPRLLSRTETLGDAALSGFVVIIAENVEVWIM